MDYPRCFLHHGDALAALVESDDDAREGSG